MEEAIREMMVLGSAMGVMLMSVEWLVLGVGVYEIETLLLREDRS